MACFSLVSRSNGAGWPGAGSPPWRSPIAPDSVVGTSVPWVIALIGACLRSAPLEKPEHPFYQWARGQDLLEMYQQYLFFFFSKIQ